MFRKVLLSITLSIISIMFAFSQESKSIIKNYYTNVIDSSAQVFYFKTLMPKKIFRAINKTAQYKVEIANKGESWNMTDVKVFKNSPDRMFVMGIQLPNGWIIVYNHGGRGFHTHIVCIDMKKSKIKWGVTSGKDISNKNDLTDMFNDGIYDVSYYDNNSLEKCVF